MPILILRRLSSNYREKQRLASRLDAAREIQRSPPPHAAPIVEGQSIAFRYRTCFEVGGDYLDIVVNLAEERDFPSAIARPEEALT